MDAGHADEEVVGQAEDEVAVATHADDVAGLALEGSGDHPHEGLVFDHGGEGGVEKAHLGVVGGEGLLQGGNATAGDDGNAVFEEGLAQTDAVLHEVEAGIEGLEKLDDVAGGALQKHEALEGGALHEAVGGSALVGLTAGLDSIAGLTGHVDVGNVEVGLTVGHAEIDFSGVAVVELADLAFQVDGLVGVEVKVAPVVGVVGGFGVDVGRRVVGGFGRAAGGGQGVLHILRARAVVLLYMEGATGSIFHRICRLHL